MGQNARLVDFGPVPVYYADEISAVELLGAGGNVRITFCQVRMIEGERLLVPEVAVIRPLSACRQPTVQLLLRAQLEMLAAVERIAH